MVLAGLAPAGLALACGGLWRRGHVVAAWAVLGVMVPAIAAGSVAVDLLGLSMAEQKGTTVAV